MVSLTIDGKNVSVAKGTTILDAAAELGIKIPTLCWLQKVSPTGACRVCVVEIEGVDRPMTACNTPVKEGIVVTTSSEKLAEIRRKTVELLLVNHPLDCPVCDAGGECDLQDSCYGLGVARQEYTALLEKRPIRYDWPLIESDPNRCILCEKCVKVDHEVVGCDAIAIVSRGEATIIDTVDGKPLNCEFCGNCVGVCPTGTLISKPFKFRGRPWAFTVTKSICPFCSTGCQIEYHSRNGRVERVTSDDTGFNEGNLCINGRFGYACLNSTERLKTPLLRQEGGSKKIADWNEAISLTVSRLQEIIKVSGPDAVAGIGSPRATNEDNYLFQKLFRAAIGTNNIDSEARFGYAPALAVLHEKLGLLGASATIDRIDSAAAIFVLGCDLNAEASVTEYRVIKAATKRDAKLVLANMRDVKLKKFSNSHLKYVPGGELALINGLIRVILDEGLEDKEFIARHVENLAELQAGLAGFSPEQAATAAGISEADLREAARLIGGRKSLAIIFGADMLRNAAVPAIVAALANLVLITGCLGKDAGGLFPVSEKNNMQGMLDMGVAPHHLPGYRSLADAVQFEQAWKTKLPTTPGRDIPAMLEGIEQGAIKALYLLACDPLSSFPDSTRVRNALAKLDLLIVQDAFPSETAALAHVVFPAALAAEKSGSFTTTDGRVQCLGKAAEPPGEAREDWDIIAEIHSRLTAAGHPRSTREIADEIKGLIPFYSGDCSRVDGRCQGMVKKGYELPEKCACSTVVTMADGVGDPAYPFTLVTGPILFHKGTMTTWSENNCSVSPRGYIEIAAEDATKAGISDGSMVRIGSAAGSVSGTARISGRLQPGLLFAPVNFREVPINAVLQGMASSARVKVEKL